MSDHMTTKTCTKCHEDKPLKDFNRQAQGRYGHNSQCKVCTRAAQAKFRKENPEKRAEWQKKHRQGNPELYAEYQRRWREKNPEASLANARKQQLAMKAATQATATNKGKKWSDDELALLLRRDLSLMEISKRLGRTYASCGVMRSNHIEHLKRQELIADVQRRLAA